MNFTIIPDFTISPQLRPEKVKTPSFNDHSLNLIDSSNLIDSLPLPDFSEQREIHEEMISLKMCDLNAEPLNDDGICSLSWSLTDCKTFSQQQDFNTSCDIVQKFLYEDKRLIIDASSKDEKQRPLYHSFKMINYFKILREDHVNQEIEYIGSNLYRFLGSLPFINLSKKTFRQVNPLFFDYLFKKNYLVESFRIKGNDNDLRFRTPGKMKTQKALSDKTIKFFSPAILPYCQFFLDKIKSCQTKTIHKISKESVPKESIKQFALTKYNYIKKKETQYVISSILTLNEKNELDPFDILFVRSLKDTHLSSLTSLSFSLTDFIEKRSFEFYSKFSRSKILIDLLLKISTIRTPTIDAWLRSHRSCARSMQKKEENIEFQMVSNVLSDQKIFEEENNIKFDSIHNYLFFLLKKEIIKIHPFSIEKFYDKKYKPSFDPHLTIPFLLRACLSLSLHSKKNLDKQLRNLWVLAEQASWFHTDDEKKSKDLNLFKIAIVDEKIPFSVLSAWLGLLAWGFKAKTATTHHKSPVFQLKEPLSCFIPIDPIGNGKILLSYFNSSCESHAFSLIFALFFNSGVEDSPLLPYFKTLNIPLNDYQKMVEDLIYHPSSFINQTGFQLFLRQMSVSSSIQLETHILQNLDLWLKNQPLEFQQNALQQLAILLPKHETLFKKSILHTQNFSTEKWIKILIKQKKLEYVLMAYDIWQQNAKKGIFFCVEGGALFQFLRIKQAPFALAVLESLSISFSIQDLSVGELLESFCLHNLDTLPTHIKRLYRFIEPLFENEKIQDRYAKELKIFIDVMSKDPHPIGITHLLMKIKSKKLLIQPWLSHKWVESLNHLIPLNPLKALCLLQIASEEKLIVCNEEIGEQIESFKSNLSKILKKEERSLSLNLLNLTENKASQEFQFRFLEMFNHYSNHFVYENFPQEFLTMCLPFINQSNLSQMNQLFKTFIHCCVENERSDPFIDELLLDPAMKKLYFSTKNEWSALILNYLKMTVFPCKHDRYAKLWTMILQTKELLSESFIEEMNNDDFAQFLAQLYFHSPNNLAKQQTWVRQKHPLLLEQLWKNACFNFYEQFLIVLVKRDHLTPTSFIWRLCCHHFGAKKEITVSSNIATLINSVSFDELKKHIIVADKKIVETITECLQLTKDFNSFQWTQFLATLSPIKKSNKLENREAIENRSFKPNLSEFSSLPPIPPSSQREIISDAKEKKEHFLSLERNFIIFEKAIEQKNPEQLLLIKSQFLKLIPKFLKDQKIGITRIQSLVTKASKIKLKNQSVEKGWLSSEELSKLCFFIFEATSIETSSEKIIPLYLKWAAHFFGSENHLKSAIKIMIPHLKEDSQENLIKIFSVPDALSSNIAAYKLCRSSYIQWVLDQLNTTPVGRKLSHECFENYVAKKMTNQAKDCWSKEEVIGLFDLLIYRFPFREFDLLFGPIAREQSILSRYSQLLDQMTQKVDLIIGKKNDFYNKREKYFSHLLWIGNFTKLNDIVKKNHLKKSILSLAKKNIEKYLEYNTQTATLRTIYLLSFFQQNIKIEEFNTNFNLYTRILEQMSGFIYQHIKQNETEDFPQTTEDYHRIFDIFKILIKETFLMPIEKDLNQIHFIKLGELYFPFTQKVLKFLWKLKNLQKNPIVEKKFYYSIGNTLEMYYIILNFKIVKTPNFNILKELKFLLPMVVELGTSLEMEWVIGQDSSYRFPKNIVDEWLYLLMQPEKNLNILKDSKSIPEIRKLLFEWINLLLEKDLNEPTSDCIILTLNYMYSLTEKLKIQNEINYFMNSFEEDSQIIIQKIENKMEFSRPLRRLQTKLFSFTFSKCTLKPNNKEIKKNILEKLLFSFIESLEYDKDITNDLDHHLDFLQKLYLEAVDVIEFCDSKENEVIYEKLLNALKTLIEKNGPLEWCPLVEESQQFTCSLLKFGVDKGLIHQSNASIYPFFQWFDKWIKESGKYNFCMVMIGLKISNEDGKETITNSLPLLDSLGNCYNESFPSPRSRWILNFIDNSNSSVRTIFHYKWVGW